MTLNDFMRIHDISEVSVVGVATKKGYELAMEECKEFISLVKRMRDTQQDIEMMERIAYKWTVDDHFKYDVLLKDKAKQESEVDEYLKKMEDDE